MAELNDSQNKQILQSIRAHQEAHDASKTHSAKGNAVVLDNGSGMLKLGLAAGSAPKATIRSIVCDSGDGRVFGEAALKQTEQALLDPNPRGIVTSWDDMEKLWSYALRERLDVDPSSHPLLLIVPPHFGAAQREKAVAILFERLKVPSLFVMPSGPLALYSAGRTTGIVFDAGDGVSHASAVVKGSPVPQSVQIGKIAGRDLTEYMRKLLTKAGAKLSGVEGGEIARAIKEKYGAVALDYDEELLGKDEIAIALPNGQKITLGSERFRCPEALFNPSLIGLEQEGIHKLVAVAVEKTGKGAAELFANVVMSGGTTMFEGIQDRMRKELAALAPESMTIKIITVADGVSASWRGGAALSSLSTFEEMWITKDEYDESGPGIVHRKCP